MVGVMGAIMLNTDTIMVGWYRTIIDVGYYGAAQRIAQLVYIVPTLIATAFFPSMAKLIADKERFRRVLEKGLSLLSLVAIPATVGGALLSREMIVILYGKDYLPAVASFRLMCLTFLPIFLSSMFGNALFSLNKERKLFTYVLVGVLGNFLFNLLLIPFFGIEGAALSTVINQTIITLYLLYILRKEFHFSVLSQLWKIVLATVIMGAGVIAARFFGINIYAIAALSLVLYFGFLYLLKDQSLYETAALIKKSLSAPTLQQ